MVCVYEDLSEFLHQWRFWGLHLGGSGVAIIAAGARTYIATVNHP